MHAEAQSPGAPSTPTLRDLPAPPAGRQGWPWTEAHAPESAASPDGRPWPRISIVVPSYQQARYVEETIRSILLQGYPDLELMVMDGGSSDGTAELLRRYDPWLSYWVSERDRGQTHAINKGLERATGEIFAYLNSDDVYEPGALHRAARAFTEHPDADVVHGGCVYMNESGRESFTVRARVRGFESYLRIWERLAERDFLTQPEVFVRRSALGEVGEFREELRSVMDFEMWLRLLSRGKRFLAVDETLARFRTYPAQKSSVDPGDELCRIVEEYARTSPALAPEARAAVLQELGRARGHLLVRAAIAANMLGRYRDAVALAFRGACANPGMLGRYEFWAVLAAPVKRLVPSALRSGLRRAVRASTG